MKSVELMNPIGVSDQSRDAKTSRRLVIVTNTARFFVSHRLHLALGAKARGYHVIAMAPPDESVSAITDHGIEFFPISMGRKSLNPVTELITLVRLTFALRKIQPSVVHLFTMKPVIYGAISCRLLWMPCVVVTMTGLGSIFVRSGIHMAMARFFMGLVFRFVIRYSAIKVVFQNRDDLSLFLKRGWVRTGQSSMIHGTGVDTERFAPRAPQAPSPIVRIAYCGRFLQDKGIRDLLMAGEIMHKRGLNFELLLCGRLDPGNPGAIGESEFGGWLARPFIKNLGYREDMENVYGNADIVCLPSYREGIPLTLIEASAAGKPIVATDVPGCREVVSDGLNGYLVPARDPRRLAEALARLIEDPAKRLQFGDQSRKRALREYDKSHVVGMNLSLYAS